MIARTFVTILLIGSTGIALAAPDSPKIADRPNQVTGQEITPAQEEAVKRGLEWLAAHQRANGSFGADGPNACGDPAAVADQIEEWIDATGADGLNLNHVVTQRSYADFVELVVPELQRRGRYRTAYDEGPTLRDKFFGRGSRLPQTHQAAQHRRDTAGALA